jgi:hypothetical protein
MLLGDAQYLVDEILIKLKDINRTIGEMQDHVRWNQMDEGIERREEEKKRREIVFNIFYIFRFEKRKRADTPPYRRTS